MKKYFSLIIFILIIGIAVVTRLYKLGEAPKGLYVDEAGQGYSAYSILKTGKDEFGKSYPIVFRSLTDFKTPIYVYLITPLIPLFDLNAFTVRFPSFFLSILTLPILYLLIKDLSGNKNLSLLSIGLLAISPWHILFGRTNFECNVALFFLLTGVLLFYRGLKKPYLLLISAIMFAIAIPAYHSQRIITPIVVLSLFIKYRKTLLEKMYRPYLIAGSFIAILITIPTLSIANTPGFLARASGLNIFSHTRQMPDGFIFEYQGVLSPIINGSWFLSTREFLSLYFSYLSPRYMFFLGDYGPRSSFPELSTFFIWQYPFYLLGIWFLLKDKKFSNLRFITLLLLLVSPIPGSVTRDPYSTIRALPLVVPQIILISIGIYELFLKVKNKNWKTILIVIFSAIIFYSLLKLHSSVITLNEYYRAKYWDWGWQQVSETIDNLKTDLPITIDNARSDGYLQLAFYQKYDPQKFQADNFEVSTEEYYTNLSRSPEKYIGNIVTKPIVWERDLSINQYLVGDELAISKEQILNNKLELVNEILYPDGTVAYRIVKTNPEFELQKKRIYFNAVNK